MTSSALQIEMHQILQSLWLNPTATSRELLEGLFKAQMILEQLWDADEFKDDPELWLPVSYRSCHHRGCNHRRYPLSRGCLFHTTGRTSLAARLKGRPALPKSEFAATYAFCRALWLAAQSKRAPATQ